MIKVKRIRHVTFVTPDIDRQIDYHQTVVGLGVVTRDAGRALLATDSDELSLAEIQALTRLNAGRTAIHVIDLGWRGEAEGSLVRRQLAGLNRGTYRPGSYIPLTTPTI